MTQTSADPGIHTIDTALERPGFDAAYLVVGDGRAAFIDCGTGHAVPHLLAALERAGVSPEQVDWLLLTHVHLDHAGGAGQLLQHLPNAQALVHPRGARHLIDPSRLLASATAVYGEEQMLRHHGRVLPVPAERVVLAPDGHIVALAGRPLLCLDAPGHARHHIVIHDAAANVFFTGDTFGISYRELDSAAGAFVLPSTSPVQFEPQPLHDSIRRMTAFQPRAMYLTHYGRVDDVQARAADLHAQIDAMVAIARRHAGLDDSRARHAAISAELADLYLQRAEHHGVPLPRDQVRELLAIDIELNSQGLAVWLQRQARTEQPAQD